MDGTQRCRIEFGLAAGESERTIAKEIGVSLSTVSREIRKHTYESFKGCYGRANQCVHRQDCKLTGVCGDCPAKGAPCVRCGYRNCSRFCDRVEYIDCSQRLLRTAKVCNGCPDEKRCHKRKLFYIAARAQEDYRRVLSEHRQGAALEPWERDYIDEIVSPKIKAGQSVHHICVTNSAKLTRHERTIQRYVNYGVLSAKRGDLKRACMVRPRKSLAREYQHKVETGCYVGRTYRDYEKFLAERPGVGPVYMDLVRRSTGSGRASWSASSSPTSARPASSPRSTRSTRNSGTSCSRGYSPSSSPTAARSSPPPRASRSATTARAGPGCSSATP